MIGKGPENFVGIFYLTLSKMESVIVCDFWFKFYLLNTENILYFACSAWKFRIQDSQIEKLTLTVKLERANNA